MTTLWWKKFKIFVLLPNNDTFWYLFAIIGGSRIMQQNNQLLYQGIDPTVFFILLLHIFIMNGKDRLLLDSSIIAQCSGHEYIIGKPQISALKILYLCCISNGLLPISWRNLMQQGCCGLLDILGAITTTTNHHIPGRFIDRIDKVHGSLQMNILQEKIELR